MTIHNSLRTHVISADGTTIAVNITGQGRPLVVVPGSLSHADDWQLVADILAPHLTSYAVDRRGHGASGDHPDFSIEREQEDIAAVLQLAGPQAILMGHSYGALVALGQSLQRPPAALIVYEPPIPIDGPVGGDALDGFDHAIQSGDLDLALTLGMRHFVKLPEPSIDALRCDPTWAVRVSRTPTWGRECRQTDAFSPDIDRFAASNTPTLLIIGEYSPPSLTEPSRRLQQVIPNSRITELSGQAHEAFLSDPDALAAAILAFTLGTTGLADANHS
jgi:pimeloyl-ACP methyl ester carboxylesterase